MEVSTGKRILLVTHDNTLRSSRLSTLAQKGYSLDYATSDADAISLIRARRYDLILIGKDAEGSASPFNGQLAPASLSGTLVLRVDDTRSVQAHVIGTAPEKLLAEIEQALQP